MVERASLDNLLGTMVGRYRLEKLLEQHPWGPIFLARAGTEDAVQGKYVVRFLQNAQALSQDARLVYLGRFQQEANRIAGLQHSAILPLLDYGNVNSLPYLVYPQLTGMSLRALLAQQGPLALLDVGRYLEQLAAALDYAHEQAVIHRGLATTSVFVQENQQLVIADFGIARLLDLGRQLLPAATMVYERSSESSAPEQLQGAAITASTDVYATGAILYRLLTAHAPFMGKTRQEIEYQHLSAPIPSLNTVRTDLPAALDDVVARAMAKQPEQRFASVGELFVAYQRGVAPLDIRTQGAQVAIPQPSARQPAVTAARVAQATAVRTHSSRASGVSRRQLITVLAIGGGVASVAAIVIANPRLLTNTTVPTTTTSSAIGANSAGAGASTSTPTHTGNVIARIADMPVTSAKTFPINGQNNPGVIVHLPNNNFVAFDSTCTHAGCPVNYVAQSQQLVCPCHSAIFDPARNAAVVQGPAKRPLAPISIVVNADGTITTV